MLIRRATWNRRGVCGLDWSEAALSLSSGLPRTRCVSWGQAALQLGCTDTVARPLQEIDNGLVFDLAPNKRLRFQERRTVALPEGATLAPEFGCAVLEFVLDAMPGAADRVDGEYVFGLKLDLDPNCRLAYQGELADEPGEPDEERYRPDWCVGSFAVFTLDGRKVGHIPRPFCYDGDGRFLWGRWIWLPADGLLYKAFPAREMDALRPPLIVDATMGYETIGGSSVSPSAGNQRACGGFNPGATWNAATIQMYTACNSGTVGSTAGILEDDGGSPGLATNVLRDTAEITLTTTPAWFEYILDSLYEVSNGLYHLGWDCTSPTKQSYYYDTNTEDLTYESLGYVSGSLQNFSSPSGAENRRVSIYAIEEEAAGTIEGAILQTLPRWSA